MYSVLWCLCVIYCVINVLYMMVVLWYECDFLGELILKKNAIVTADVELRKAALPTYSDMRAALEQLIELVEDVTSHKNGVRMVRAKKILKQSDTN